MQLRSGAERFTADDLCVLSQLVSDAWASAADRDWSVPAGSQLIHVTVVPGFTRVTAG